MSIRQEFRDALEVLKPIAAGAVGGMFVGGMIGNHGYGIAGGLVLGAAVSLVECYRQQRGRRPPPPSSPTPSLG